MISWTAACQAPLSMKFARLEYCNSLKEKVVRAGDFVTKKERMNSRDIMERN